MDTKKYNESKAKLINSFKLAAAGLYLIIFMPLILILLAFGIAIIIIIFTMIKTAIGF